MANNKIVLGTETLIDLTEDTVTADTLLEGYTAHNASGEQITGTAVAGSSSSENVQTGTVSASDTSSTQTIDTGIDNLASFCMVRTGSATASCLLSVSIVGDNIFAMGLSKSSYYSSYQNASSLVSVSGSVVTIKGGTASTYGGSAGMSGDYVWVATEASEADIANTQNALSDMGVESSGNYMDDQTALGELGVR